MDEPFAALDFQTRLAMQELRCGLWHEIHPKIFFITHDVEEAIFLADRVYVMSAAPGRIKEVLDVTLLHGSAVARSQPRHPLSCEANVLRPSKLQHAVQ
jgi:NitT/TauT family transport system ATP-binding protein